MLLRKVSSQVQRLRIFTGARVVVLPACGVRRSSSPAQILNEHAVHSLERGAVWVTTAPDLPADQVSALGDRVTGSETLFMSPFPERDAPISV